MKIFLLLAALTISTGLHAEEMNEAEADRFIRVAYPLVEALNSRDFEAFRRDFNQRMLDALPLLKTRDLFQPIVQKYGKIQKLDPPTLISTSWAVFPAHFERTVLDLKFYLDEQGKIGGLQVKPHSKDMPMSEESADSSQDATGKSAQSGVLAKYPDANILFVEKLREIKYEENGTYRDRNRMRIKILKEPAVSYLGTLPVCEYYRDKSEAKVLFSRVIKSDGAVIEVPEENIVDVINPMYSSLNVIDSTMRLININFTNLAVGDAVEFEVEENCVRPVSPYYDLIEGKYFQEDEPVIHTRVEINGPSSQPLNYRVKCAKKLKIKFSSHKKDGRLIYVWEARDIPPFISEPGWNTRQHFAARLTASTISSWREKSRDGYRINEPSINQDDSLRAVTAEITRGLATDEERITSILSFLRKNIVYKSTTTVSQLSGKPATQTLAERFGVCRDIAVLMCSMLNVSGIKSYPAATGYGRVIDDEVPHDIFQHMIVAVPDHKGGYELYDPSFAIFSGDRLPGYASDAALLVFRPEGEDLIRIPIIPASENMGTIDAESRIDTSGRLSSTVKISGLGHYDKTLRDLRKRSKPEEYNNEWKEIIARLHPGASLTEFSSSDPDDLDIPFSLSFSYEVPGYAIPAGDTLVVRPPLCADYFERVLDEVIGVLKQPERKYPFILVSTISAFQKEILILPAGYAVKSMPESLSLKKKNLDLAIQYKVSVPPSNANGLQIEFRKKLLVNSRQLDPKGYLDMRKIMEANSNSRAVAITLSKQNRTGAGY